MYLNFLLPWISPKDSNGCTAAWNLRVSHKMSFSFHLNLRKCLRLGCPFLVPPLVSWVVFVWVWFVVVLFFVTPLLRWLTEPLGTGVHRQPTTTCGPGTMQPGGTELPRSPVQSLSERKRNLRPHGPSATAPPIWLLHHLEHQEGQTLGQNAFSSSSLRHGHTWVPSASPSLCSPVKQGRQFRKQISNKKRKNPRSSGQLYFQRSRMGGPRSSPMLAAGLERRRPGVHRQGVLRPVQWRQHVRQAAAWVERSWRGGAPWDPTTSTGQPESLMVPSGLKRKSFQKRGIVSNHPEEGPLRPPRAAECRSWSCQSRFKTLLAPGASPAWSSPPPSPSARTQHSHGEPATHRAGLWT